jgi:electron transport complex protein RnfG
MMQWRGQPSPNLSLYKGGEFQQHKLMLSILAIVMVLVSSVCFAKTITREEALKSAFPGTEIHSEVLFLTEAEKKEAEKASGASITTLLVARSDLTQNGKAAGRAYLDTHVVRTKKESLLVMLNPDGSLKRVEVVAFLEPPEYMPSDRWYRQFDGKALNENLKLDRDIRAVTGATLTARATTEAVRRVMAIDAIVQRRKGSS